MFARRAITTLLRYPLLTTLYRSQGCQLYSIAGAANLHHLYHTILYYFTYIFFHLLPFSLASHQMPFTRLPTLLIISSSLTFCQFNLYYIMHFFHHNLNLLILISCYIILTFTVSTMPSFCFLYHSILCYSAIYTLFFLYSLPYSTIPTCVSNILYYLILSLLYHSLLHILHFL